MTVTIGERSKLGQEIEAELAAGVKVPRRMATVTLTLPAPALVGSDKQVAWAQDIRSKAVQALYNRATSAPNYADNAARMEAGMRTVLTERTDAKWWIDSRNDGRILAQALAAAVAK